MPPDGTIRDDEIQDRVDLGPLQRLIARLRGPDGCPWDREQTLDSVRAYLIEEAHEAAAAIDSGDREALAEELGDLLFQLVFVGRLAEEEGAFTLARVAEKIHAKMVARHPHVFGPERLGTAEAVAEAWEARKIRTRESILDGVPASLPALTGAYRLSQKASAVGFDWPDATSVLAKVHEELAEVAAELAGSGSKPEEGALSEGARTAVTDGAPETRDALEAEIGDLLFAVANLARHVGLDPELALARGNRKFRRRFARVEGELRARGRPLSEASLAEMDDVWNAVKAEEKGEDTTT